MPDASPPSVSVVIPAYDASAFIRATLESVFRQTFSNFEVIVVNDGSNDTKQLEAALQPYVGRIRYLRQENRGPASARNAGIREASGRYVAFLDSDDVWLPQHLQRQIDHFNHDSRLGLVYANNIQLRGEAVVGPAFESVRQSGPVTLESLLAEECTVNTSSVVVARSALEQAGLFDEGISHCEDFDLWLRLAEHGVQMTYDRDVHVIHRLGHGLSSNREGMKRGRAAVYRKAAATLPLNSAQRQIVARKLKQLEVEIEVEVAKQHLREGRFGEARSALERASSISHAAKLRFACAGLQYCPRLVRWSYNRYIRFLHWYKRAARTSGAKSAKERQNLDVLMRQGS